MIILQIIIFIILMKLLSLAVFIDVGKDSVITFIIMTVLFIGTIYYLINRY